MKEYITSAKDYQLESLIRTFTRFRSECATNTEEAILKDAITLAKTELAKREEQKELETRS